MTSFGELLSELRLDHKMTQQDLAGVLHVSVGTISNYEKGVHFPDIEKLINIADFFHVTTDYLLGRCQSNISPDAFAEVVSQGKTVGEVIETLRQLPTDRKDAVLLVMGDLEFCATVNRYSKRKDL